MAKSDIPTILLVHGWGFDRNFFGPLMECLPNFICATVDIGFTGDPVTPDLDPNTPVLAVGHSLGFMWLLKHRPVRWRGLVGINAFPRFTETEGYSPAQPARVLEIMQMQFVKNPAQVAADFMAQFGRDKHGEEYDMARMEEGLIWLADWDERAALANEPTPIFSLAGKGDQIVPSAMTETGFGGIVQTQWHDGGHLLPLEDPMWCADRLIAAWDTIS
jgi:pimeloyl-[acyl-carrier protein] methyl ester esterase